MRGQGEIAEDENDDSDLEEHAHTMRCAMRTPMIMLVSPLRAETIATDAWSVVVKVIASMLKGTLSPVVNGSGDGHGPVARVPP